MRCNLTLALYNKAKERGFGDAFYQYQDPIRVMQYVLPHEKTLSYLQPGMHVLDWGCGNGHFSWFLLENGFATTAYSFDAAPAAIATHPLFQHVRADENEPVHLPFPDASFDAVFSIGVLEHVHETGGSQAASLGEIARILKPNGCFLCFHLPNKWSWVECLIGALRRVRPSLPYSHSRRFTIAEARDLLRQKGLETIEAGLYDFLPRNAIGRHFPKAVHLPLLARSFEVVDHGLMHLARGFCQQIYFVARKPA